MKKLNVLVLVLLMSTFSVKSWGQFQVVEHSLITSAQVAASGVIYGLTVSNWALVGGAYAGLSTTFALAGAIDRLDGYERLLDVLKRDAGDYLADGEMSFVFEEVLEGVQVKEGNHIGPDVLAVSILAM